MKKYSKAHGEWSPHGEWRLDGTRELLFIFKRSYYLDLSPEAVFRRLNFHALTRDILSLCSVVILIVQQGYSVVEGIHVKIYCDSCSLILCCQW